MKKIEGVLERLSRAQDSIYKNIQDSLYRESVPEVDGLLIWQYLRFNPKYRNMYDNIKKEDTHSRSPDELENIYPNLGARWGLNYAENYDNIELSESVYFKKPFRVKRLNSLQMSEAQLSLYFNEQDGLPPLFLIINALTDKSEILAETEKLIDKVRSEYFENELEKNKVSYIAPRAVKSLVQNFSIFYYWEVEDIRDRIELTSKLVKLNLYPNEKGEVLKKNQVESKIAAFKKISLSSPWCFFNKPQTIK